MCNDVDILERKIMYVDGLRTHYKLNLCPKYC